MLMWAIFFLIISFAAGALGFTTLATKTGTIAKVLFVICFVLFVAAVLIIIQLLKG
jgi:uncharacterized membrane protein YtjA (UPF0391 family)